MPAIITNNSAIVAPKTGKAKRVVANVTKPTTAAATVAASAATVPAAAPAKNPLHRGIIHDIAGIAAQRTNFGGETDRDRAYLSFFATFAGDKRDASFTLATIRESNRVPAGAFQSAKPTDVGAINRLVKNGMLTFRGDTLTLTAKAQAAKLD